jgi:dynein heavy chain
MLWKDMELDYAPHNGTETFLIKPSEEVIEGLESHQLELQSMIGTCYD